LMSDHPRLDANKENRVGCPCLTTASFRTAEKAVLYPNLLRSIVCLATSTIRPIPPELLLVSHRFAPFCPCPESSGRHSEQLGSVRDQLLGRHSQPVHRPIQQPKTCRQTGCKGGLLTRNTQRSLILSSCIVITIIFCFFFFLLVKKGLQKLSIGFGRHSLQAAAPLLRSFSFDPFLRILFAELFASNFALNNPLAYQDRQKG
jgi:hypothetical protein